MPTLYLVGTPIGNLEDITLRALRVLGEVALVAAEDTRTTGRLLRHYKIETPLISYHDHNKGQRTSELVERLATEDIALVSDAGMPGLSDPGYKLVAAVVAAGYTVSPIPGPSAAVTALISSGLPTDHFLFYGFLPRQKGARRKTLQELADFPYTLVFYESPHRLVATLADIQQVLGDGCTVVVGRELTKLYEEIWRGSPAGAMEHFGQAKVRGEVTLVVFNPAGSTTPLWDTPTIQTALHQAIANGASRKDAATTIAAQSGWRKRDVYALAIKLEIGD